MLSRTLKTKEGEHTLKTYRIAFGRLSPDTLKKKNQNKQNKYNSKLIIFK